MQIMDGRTYANHGHTQSCIPIMRGGAKAIKNGQWFDMKPIARIMLPDLQVVKMNK
jgi:hypothetical protein